MTFSVEGDYFEVCNCDVSCNCVWLGAATNDNCDVLLAWHVTRGSKDGVDPHRFRRHHPKWHDGLRGENRKWDRLARSTPRNIRTRLWSW